MIDSNFRKLIVWQKSMDLVDKIYEITDVFPKSEMFSLTNQLRRSVVSVPSNIAEGSRRGTKKDFSHFIAIALGSIAETETQLEIALRRKYLSSSDHGVISELIMEITRILYKLSSNLKTSR